MTVTVTLKEFAMIEGDAKVALEGIAQNTANVLLKKGAVRLLKKAVPIYGQWSTISDVICYGECLAQDECSAK